MITIGDNLKNKRLQLRLSQLVLAQQLNVRVNTVANWEHRRSIPDICRLPKIIEFLGYDPLETGRKAD
jgi:transcriptional regulator with XRE-family HTH domain